MRFMIIRRADKNTEAGVMPSETLLAAMTRYNEELLAAGVLLGGDGLHPTSKGAVIKFTAGTPSVVDGPFAEAKELIAGFTMIQVASREDALAWVKRWPAVDLEADVELELRQVFEADDFGEAFTPELRAAEERMRDELSARQSGGSQQ